VWRPGGRGHSLAILLDVLELLLTTTDNKATKTARHDLTSASRSLESPPPVACFFRSSTSLVSSQLVEIDQKEAGRRDWARCRRRCWAWRGPCWGAPSARPPRLPRKRWACSSGCRRRSGTYVRSIRLRLRSVSYSRSSKRISLSKSSFRESFI